MIGSIAIGVLTVAAGGLAVANSGTERAVPAPTIAAPADDGSPTPTTTDDAAVATQAVATDTITTDTIAGQAVWLARPAAAPVGIAYILPDLDDNPETLVQDTTAATLLADGWAVGSGALAGRSWGSPASSQRLEQLRGWVDEQLGQLPVLYVGAGMGGTTAITSMSRQPSLAVACWYAVAPVTDLAALAGAQPAVVDQISTAWQRIPTVQENPSLFATALPLETSYRVVIPASPAFLADDANRLLSSLQESGHTVTSVTSPENATPTSLADDLIAFAESCTA